MKFRAHDTFFIRKGWLSKGMKYVNAKEDIFIAKDENPMDVLGIGANMVKALRYWLQAVGLTEGGESSVLLPSEIVYLITTAILRKAAHYTSCSIVSLVTVRMQPPGTTSSTSSICLSSAGMTS